MSTQFGHQQKTLLKCQQVLTFKTLQVLKKNSIAISNNLLKTIQLTGCIDGTDIFLKQPLKDILAFTNRKSVTSVKLQAVCDSTMKFIDVICGWPGSMHDSRIFSMSTLGRTLNEKLEDTVYHVLGDSAYALSVRLITPYRDNGHMTPVCEFFHYSQS